MKRRTTLCVKRNNADLLPNIHPYYSIIKRFGPWLRSLEQRQVTAGTQTELPSATLINDETAFVEEKMTRAVVETSL